jgi:very-short-patch-repair endonuclease
VIGHQLERGRTATVQTSTMRMTDAATTWCQLATLLEVEDLVAVGDFLVTGREQLGGRPAAATIDTLRAAVSMRHGGAGVARLRDALVHVRRGPLSRRETLLRLRLVRRGLPEPVVAYRVREPLLAPFEPTVDLAYPGARIAIEYEGDHHRTPEQFRRDIARYERLHDAGWVVLRVTARDIPDGEGRISPVLVERVATRLRKRGLL